MSTVDIDDIVIASDIAFKLGVVQSAVNNWQQRDLDFPEPFKVVGAASGRRGHALYRWSEIVEWYAKFQAKGRTMDIETMRAIVKAHDERQGD